MAFTDQGAYLDTSERVHIGGTGDPVVSLKVTGQVYATDNITAYYSSDITLKNNIRPIESAIFKVKQIRYGRRKNSASKVHPHRGTAVLGRLRGLWLRCLRFKKFLSSARFQFLNASP